MLEICHFCHQNISHLTPSRDRCCCC